MEAKKFIKRLLSGIPIGVGAAIPGVSASAVAMVIGIYEELLNAINLLRKDFKYSIKVLIPVCLGVIIGILPCFILFNKAFEMFAFGLICIFAGFLIGSLKSITIEIKNEKPSKKQIFIFIMSLIGVIIAGLLSIYLSPLININTIFETHPFYLYLILVPVGCLTAITFIIPGLSGSLFLLIIGFYKPILKYVLEWLKELFNGETSNLTALILVLISFILGFLIGIVIASKVMKHFLNKHKKTTYFAILGFIIGSIVVLFYNKNIYDYYLFWLKGKEISQSVNPLLPIYLEIPIGIILLIISFIISRKITNKSLNTKL